MSRGQGVMRRVQGTWRPGLPAPISRLVLWLLTIEVLVRGSDYLPGDPPGVTQSLTIVEQALPLPVWGVLCLIAGSMVTVGIILRHHILICAGGGWCIGIYGALAWGLFLRFLERGEPWGGWRTPAHFAMMSALWVAVTVGTFWRHQLDEKSREEGLRRAAAG